MNNNYFVIKIRFNYVFGLEEKYQFGTFFRAVLIRFLFLFKCLKCVFSVKLCQTALTEQ